MNKKILSVAISSLVCGLYINPNLAWADDANLKIGGAVRFQYINESYDNSHQKGSMDFDTFRLNIDGKKEDLVLSAEWRWYNNMNTLHHAWVGYDFNKYNQVQAGLILIPFGNQSYNSHSLFFSSNYYLGLEETYALGAKYIFNNENFNVQAALVKNSANGLDGTNENFSFALTQDSSDEPAGTINTGVLRATLKSQPTQDLRIEAGASVLHGQLHNIEEGISIGNYGAYAIHADINYGRFNTKLQATKYDYDFQNDDNVMILGAYGNDYDTPTSGDTYTAGVAYYIPLNLKNIDGIDIYNDFSLVNHKSDGFDKTTMNVLGVGISAGAVYTYIDYIAARNQPFLGDTFVSNGQVNHRFNINVGYYF